MQTFPKLNATVVTTFGGTTLIAAPNNFLIRLHRAEVSIPNNDTVAVAGAIQAGISYTPQGGGSNDMYDEIFLQAIAITTIPGSIQIKRDFGPLGVLCYTSAGISAVYSVLSQNLSVIASFTLFYNFEAINA